MCKYFFIFFDFLSFSITPRQKTFMRLERKYMPFMPVLALHTRTTTREDTTSQLFLSIHQSPRKKSTKIYFCLRMSIFLRNFARNL